MTSSQTTLLSLIRTVVRGAQDVSLMMDACGSKAADESWAKVMEGGERKHPSGVMLQDKEILCEQMEARAGVPRRDMEPAVVWWHRASSKVRNDKGLGLAMAIE